ncbi:F0F1 ATP synthase subunit B [Celeribacter halophilus]|jgi:F-type H+-transporting ATPase subunit b|uniref:ATP synthase subunit b n=1 Tax=Celeribacter halophilus TaxID=576117 RepID=A0AAW7XT30_9RHOB|nr:F0F1 ATP synthase subunit B [Celeribacter halophilus]MBU2888954.1 F0F1 ATP synthase subunit B [Celeribacter halophilus]MDO6456453.1 F0F1 ATP synthase subunit B [Celeribacter halophilus]MDO6510517.1 F0F1 ATP synthase subunit B [Celeribacter halophilus]MDO6722916.1 F0F1 ATP synthase subunit B [Celeribacter halophilus]
MKKLSLLLALTVASPAFAASGPFFSLKNTNFVVLLGFLVFIGILIWKKVPAMIGGMLDQRAEGIKAELDEARTLREEAQSILASYERKQREVQEQADAIVAQAKKDSEAAAAKAKEDLKSSIARRVAAAEEQISAAEAAAIREVRDTAVDVAIAAASDVIAKKMSAAEANDLIDNAIADVSAKLH